MKKITTAILSLALACGCFSSVSATDHAEGFALEYHGSLTASAGAGNFTPYYIASNRHGIITQANNALLNVGISRPLELDKRFSYAFGVDLYGGYGSNVDYLRFRDGAFVDNPQHPSSLWVQQLYGTLKYRQVFLTVGNKEFRPAYVDPNLASGDLVYSGNARPIPQVRAGFLDFVDIPLINGWVQIQGEISYGKMTDNGWMRHHYNYYNQHINTGALYTYKRCFLRSKKSMPFTVMAGMQVGSTFGGTTVWYVNGVRSREMSYARNLKQMLKILIPHDGNSGNFYTGSTLGSWDILLRYRFHNGYTLRGYFQKPFEDGSGIGFLNGADGVWGLEFKTNCGGPVSAAVVEFLDFTNQSGPMHWAPGDNPGTGLQGHASGADDYYNNHEFNPYANYGMAIGNPMLVSPIYNTDGCMMFLYNRLRGFHIALEGTIIPGLDYRLKGGYRKSWGNGYIPLIDPVDNTSLMAEVDYSLPAVKGLNIKGQLGLDHGRMMGNNFGACLTVGYTGILNFKRK